VQRGGDGQHRFDTKSTRHSLGIFDTREEAALAYDRKARHCGDKPLNYENIAAAEEAAVKAKTGYTLVHELCAGPQQPKPRPASGFYGVSANKMRWQAHIYYDSNKLNLGSFDTKEEAALVYDAKARQCGEEKPLNYASIKEAEDAAVQ
jgi:hypothetical protein